MNTTTLLSIALSFSFSCSCFANFIGYGATNDLWDISQGTTIIQNSQLNLAAGPNAYDARDIFGGSFTTYLPESGGVIFADGMPSGFVHFIEWHTPAPVTVRSFSLLASGDGANQSREFSTFRLLAKSVGSTNFDVTLFTFSPSHPYTFSDYSHYLLISSDVQATNAQDFRAEFVNRTGVPFSGPRIVELDGFGDFISTQATIRLSQVEICWNAGPGVNYQVEYRSDLTGGTWLALGAPVQGTGGKTCVTDQIPEDGT